MDSQLDYLVHSLVVNYLVCIRICCAFCEFFEVTDTLDIDLLADLSSSLLAKVYRNVYSEMIDVPSVRKKKYINIFLLDSYD